MKNLKNWLNDKDIIKYCEKLIGNKYKDILFEISNVCDEKINKIEIDIENAKKIIYDRYTTGLSLLKIKQHSFLEVRKCKKNNVYIQEISLMPQYKGLLHKAKENGYDIKCDYILRCELDDLKIDENENQIFINNNKRFLYPTPNIPKLKWENQTTIENDILNYDWKEYDIVGFYVIIKDIKTYKNIRIDKYNLSELMERTMEIDNFTKNKKIKNKFIKSYLGGELMMITNSIEALKIRAIRLSCKVLTEELANITNIIDNGDGYVNNFNEKINNFNLDKYKLSKDITFKDLKIKLENIENIEERKNEIVKYNIIYTNKEIEEDILKNLVYEN